MPTITHKRGATLRTSVRLATSSIEDCEISGRVICGAVATEVSVRPLLDAPGWVEITVSAEETATWPVSAREIGPYTPARCDVRIAWPNGHVAYSDTLLINVLPEVTDV